VGRRQSSALSRVSPPGLERLLRRLWGGSPDRGGGPPAGPARPGAGHHPRDSQADTSATPDTGLARPLPVALGPAGDEGDGRLRLGPPLQEPGGVRPAVIRVPAAARLRGRPA